VQEWGVGDRCGHGGVVECGNDSVIFRFRVRNELLSGGEDCLGWWQRGACAER
jgi:hypothetical protein